MRRIVLVLLTALTLGQPAAAADPVQLTIHAGRVTLVATNATVRQILAKWEQVGLTQIVNGDRVPGGLITLQLIDVPEGEALDLLLRSAGGYIAAPRATALADGSRFDRIVILPTSAAPASAASRGSAPTPAPAFQQPQVPAPIFAPSGAERIIGPDGEPVPDDQEDTTGEPRPPQRYVPLPPGFAEPPSEPTDPVATTPSTPSATPTSPTGAPVPGMVPAPAPSNGPREVQPLGPDPR